MTVSTNGVLLIYNRPVLHRDASTVWDHIKAFAEHSEFRVWEVNTGLGFPSGLRSLRFGIIVLHYSLFGYRHYTDHLNADFLEYLLNCKDSYKIAFFQDEHRQCKQRFEFINRFAVDCIYTLVAPQYFAETYQKYTRVPKLVYHIPGYVSDDLARRRFQFCRPDEERAIDVGYRGRRLEYYSGRGAQEKYEIAERFQAYAQDLGLRLDIETSEEKRIYGDAWYHFLGSCRACLGVEAGVSVFDIEDVVRDELARWKRERGNFTFEEFEREVLRKWEGNIPYRTVSPRVFEAAALQTCQILYEGKYSGVVEPLVHYIPLKKDFSNFDDVIAMFRNAALRRQITSNATRDLIDSGRYTYRRFIEGFDRELRSEGLIPGISETEAARVTERLNEGQVWRKLSAGLRSLRYVSFPGRKHVRRVVKPLLASSQQTATRVD